MSAEALYEAMGLEGDEVEGTRESVTVRYQGQLFSLTLVTAANPVFRRTERWGRPRRLWRGRAGVCYGCVEGGWSCLRWCGSVFQARPSPPALACQKVDENGGFLLSESRKSVALRRV